MSITPLILGKGRAGAAIAKSLSILNLLNPEMQIENPVWLERGTKLEAERKKYKNTALFISNPHGLHAEAIIEADIAGFDAILCEKPACVNMDQIQKLRNVRTPTALFHVYRQMWGLQTLKQMLESGQFGEVITMEGRYWQSSTAERALNPNPPAKSWKDDTRLSGNFDAYLDIATHWVDALSFLQSSPPSRIMGWRSYAGAVSSHRDSHVQLMLDFPDGGRGFGSISKAVHGSTNHFEINVIGSKLSASWEFLKPDEIFVGEGRDRRVLTRKDSKLGSQNSPFHALGWIEGYIEITSSLFQEVFLGRKMKYPSLGENLDVLSSMFKTEWLNDK